MSKIKRIQLLVVLLSCVMLQQNAAAQCNTNISICTPGVAGPFNFNTPGPPVSTCLDFFGPSVTYITLYITQSGPLELLIDGDATSGFIDVAIFNVPNGVDPCVAINNTANEIGCNYASNASGCNQFGTAFPCVSSVPSPVVTAGDELMIVVENWSGASFTFNMQLSGTGAQTGPPNPTITPVGSVPMSTPPWQMTAASAGGTWSATCGACIDPATGMFNPSMAGPGNHTVCYDIGASPCDAQDCHMMTITTPLSVDMNYATLECESDAVNLSWGTLSEHNSDYFLIEKSKDGTEFEFVGEVAASGTTNENQYYTFSDPYDRINDYYRITQVDIDQSEEIVGTFFASCNETDFEVYPNPADDKLHITLNNFELGSTTIQIMDPSGRIVLEKPTNQQLEYIVSLENLGAQIYTVLVSDRYTQKMQRFSKL